MKAIRKVAASLPRVESMPELAQRLLREVAALEEAVAVKELETAERNLSLRVDLSLKEKVRRFEIALIARALKQTRGNQKLAANILGVKTTTLNHKIKALQIDPSAAGDHLAYKGMN